MSNTVQYLRFLPLERRATSTLALRCLLLVVIPVSHQNTRQVYSFLLV